MTAVLAMVGMAALFVAFGALRPGAGRGCGSCSCGDGACRLEAGEDGEPGADIR